MSRLASHAVALGLCATLGACYLSPDKHRVSDESATGNDVGAGDLDAGTPSVGTDAQPGSKAEGGTLDSGRPSIDAGCVDHSACPREAPVCQGGYCVGCKQHDQCNRFANTPACGPNGTCVVCAGDAGALCTGGTPACDPATNRCVACVADNDCADKRQAACRPDRTCGACSEDVHCQQFGDVCERDAGVCVQCRPSSEEADCRSDRACDPTNTDCLGTACDPKNLTCTNVRRRSRAVCGACVSDSECAADHRCIPMYYGAAGTQQELDGFCLKIGSTGCDLPFLTLINRSSLSGAAPATHCGINEKLTSCPAVAAQIAVQSCPGGDAGTCGAPGGRCETVNNRSETCTYSCESNLECLAATPCGSPQGKEKYCGGVD